MNSLTENLYTTTGTKCECGGAIIMFPRMRVCDKCGAYAVLKKKNDADLPAGAQRFLIDSNLVVENI